MIKNRRFSTLLFCGILIIIGKGLFGQGVDSTANTSQKQLQLHSKVLGVDRAIWIHTPAGYDQSSDSYPVIYLLDADTHFNYVSEMVEFLSSVERNRTPEMIVVGIVSENRINDFTPIHSLVIDGRIDSGLSTTGGGEHFLHFIQDELAPYIDQHYRTQPYRILEAHSLAGLFGLYAKEASPNLFQSEILMSPAFYGGNHKILTDFPEFLSNHPQLSGNMFVSIENEQGRLSPINTLASYLKNGAPASFRWSYRSYPDEDHFSLPYKSMYDGLRFIYSTWFINVWNNDMLLTHKTIMEHFDSLSSQYGYRINPSEDFINECGYKQLRAKHVNQAIALFQQNVKSHPNSFNVYDSMGEAFMKNGQKELAIEYYEKSIALNPNNEGGKDMLRKLKSE
jgi:predicted alpha/beta superfamily hydrolase